MAHLDSELLSAYIDGELSPEDMAQVERHLAACEACTTEYDELRGISTLVRELPTYLPRRVIEIEASDSTRRSDVMAQVIEFGKPLAVAAIILLVAFTGLRLLSDLGEDDDAGDDQISFSAVQVTPVDGTESAARSSESIAAMDSESDAAGAPPEQREDPADTAPMQEAASDSEETSQPAPAVTPEPPDDEDGESRFWVIAGVVAVVIIVAGSAAWYTFSRSPQRPRS